MSSGLVLVSLGRLGWGRLVWFGEQVPMGHELLPTLGVGTLVFLLMLGCVMAVVHHADQLADMLREPYGTLVLTLSVTVIEVSLMLRVMLQGAENPTLLRDTVFVVLMITMNGMVGLALTAGGWRHVEQSFNLHGAIAYVQLIAPLYLLLLIMPNYTISFDGPTLVPLQETYLGALCLAVYMLFLLIQTRRHRSYFEHTDVATIPRASHLHEPKQWNRLVLASSICGLVFALLPMVLLSEYLGEAINYGIDEFKLPTALGGLIIASLGLIPEIIGALRAALANQIQRSANICLGSALSTIGLTVPSVMIVAAYLGMELTLGVRGDNATLLLATLLVIMLTFVKGGASILQGIVHLMLFLGYLIFIVYP
ncbi:MAG: calcium/proton transporter [Methylococcaceae bacterium]